MMKTERTKVYRVKRGQTLVEIAEHFCVSPFLLAKINGIYKEVEEGQILRIPDERGNRYVVRAGDTKILLCGSESAYEKKNGTAIFYIGMRVIL
jgi:LysM repeat protein